jgi:hypothetical protein
MLIILAQSSTKYKLFKTLCASPEIFTVLIKKQAGGLEV